MTGYFDREEPKQEGSYLVLWHRDMNTEKSKNYGQKILYDYGKNFKNLNDAIKFALSNLPSSAMKKLPISEDDKKKARDPQKPYIVAAKFDGKYHHYSYDGSSDSLTNYDVLRCDESSLEKVIESFAKEGAKEITIGIELKLI